jgi:lipopolysaccharide transport system ATP-binding protein
MGAVQNLCQRCILLEKGSVKFIGTVTDSISAYQMSFANSPVFLKHRTDRMGSGKIRVTAIELRNLNGDVVDTVSCAETFDIFLYFEATSGFEESNPIVSIAVKTPWDVPVFLIHNRMTGDTFGKLPLAGAFVCRISDLSLVPSLYKLDYSIINNGDYLDGLTSAADIDVISGNFYGTGEVPPASHGVCMVKGRWRIST